ncbi:uncharacterized protein A4U43_C07F27330 [Asparagus officinalis]|uniref:Uncharacterized protein n=1 Tax=Asparagus officinalis TaxID=4686 RepID=A0A5P1EH85_ASPOF|nr:F-box/WD-40 repeat-containing protein At3g52030 [Asparagus officinalis]ONK64557.1 uncharacterized protein A4U43_C07F27330 [Asparagus officinalis]
MLIRARINVCRMKRGLILTGAEDKVLRLWSAESYNSLDEYAVPDMNPLVDYDFDEGKIVGLSSGRMCILRRNGKRSILQFCEASSTRGLCMRYIDPEAVVGCDDGRARVLDMYTGRCSRIIRMHGGPLTCIDLTEDQLIFGGSTFGTVSVADLSTGELLASLKSSCSPTGIKSLHFNMHSHLLFAGSTAGYAHCWDLRTLRPLWETRVSPNVIYSVHHLLGDTSTLALGGLDGILRLVDQNTGEFLSSVLMDSTSSGSSTTSSKAIETKRARSLGEGVHVDSIPRSLRPPITCLAVGLNKIVTTHNEKYIKMWRFDK